jgi:hypothetical protein
VGAGVGRPVVGRIVDEQNAEQRPPGWQN